MPNVSGQSHTGYRSIDATPLANVTPGEGIAFDGNGATGRRAGTGTLGFFGHDLGSSAPTQGRVPAFLGLAERTGGVYVEDAPTVGEALRQTGLDFEVRHDPIMAMRQADVPVIGDDGELTMQRQQTGEQLRVGEWVATVAYPRDGGQPFAIAPTSARYTIVQNEDLLSMGDAISEGRLRALGAFGNPIGSRVYAAYELGDGFTVGGGDPYRSFVTLVNTHDRNGGYGVMAPIRLGCTNQAGATFGRKATPRFVIRHTGDATVKIEEARRILGLAHHYVEALVEESETLLAIPMNTDRFLVYAKELFGAPDPETGSKRALQLSTARNDELLAILASETCAFGAGTAYAGHNAVTEYLDHFSPARGGEAAQTARRQERILIGKLDRAKERAWDLAAALA